MKKFIYLLLISFFVFTSCNQDEEIIDLSTQNKPNTEKENKVSICHYDIDSNTWHTITINENALKAHTNHGDRIGGGCEDYTYVPDDNFEQALIDLGIDKDGLNDYVLTSDISLVTTLNVSYKAISDLTGIEDFVSLRTLRCNDNLLTVLNISNNLELFNLFSQRNEIDNLDVSNNLKLKELFCGSNKLTSINVMANLDLRYLYCELNNITDLDLTNNTKLTRLVFRNNNLEKLNIKNNNNTLITKFIGKGNVNLTCIQVDNAIYSSLNWTNKDSWASFSEDCGY